MDRTTLKDILKELDPQTHARIENREELDAKYMKRVVGLEDELKTVIEKTIGVLVEKFTNELVSIRSQSLDKIALLEKAHDSLSSNLRVLKEEHGSLRKKDREEMSKMLREEIDSQGNEHDKKLKELAISLKRVGFGGGSMPLIPQVEVPTGTLDGTNAVFKVQHNPLWIEVSGQLMVSKSQDTTNYGYTVTGVAPWTITFVNPPSAGQTPHSFYV